MRDSPRVLVSAAVLVCIAGAAAALAPRQGGPQEAAPSQPPSTGAAPTAAPSEVEPPAAKLTAQELDELLGSIALYPDPLIAQILPASTYPLEVVQAARWVRAHPGLEGLDEQDWDPSVKALAHYPTVLAMMDEKLDWTMRLGRAFADQQQDVMDSIQQLRTKARAAGTLRDTPQQQIVVDQEAVRIVPTEPDVIYVPSYNPAVVYVSPPVGWYYEPYITFGTGFALGWWLDLDCDWHHHDVYYHWWYPYWDHHRPYGPEGWEHGHPGPDWHRGHEGDVWRRDPHRGSPYGGHPRGTHGPPPGGARGWPASPGAPGGNRPHTPGPAPGGRPGGVPPGGAGAHPSPGQPHAQPTAPRGSFGGYERGSQTLQQSARGQSSRGSSGPQGVRPATPSSAPRGPAPRAAPMRPAPSAGSTPHPAPSHGVFGGYRPGPTATSQSQRGTASRGSGGGGARGGGGRHQ